MFKMDCPQTVYKGRYTVGSHLLEHGGTKECLNNWISETLFVFKAEYFNLMHSEISLFWGFGYLHSTISSLTLRCLAIIRCHPATVTTIIVSIHVYHTSTSTAKCLVSSNVNQDNLKLFKYESVAHRYHMTFMQIMRRTIAG